MNRVERRIAGMKGERASRDGCVRPARPHDRCLMCGPDNPRSLGLVFAPDGPEGVVATFRAFDELQGYPGLLHGGMIASLLDAAMTHCLFRVGVEAVTGDLHVRYLAPIGCRDRLVIRARLKPSMPPLYRLEAEVEAHGAVAARAAAKFVRRSSRQDGMPLDTPAGEN